MNSYDISVKSHEIDTFYISINKGVKFLIFFIIAYWIVEQNMYETLYKVILLMVLFYILDFLYPSCELNIIEQKSV